MPAGVGAHPPPPPPSRLVPLEKESEQSLCLQLGARAGSGRSGQEGGPALRLTSRGHQCPLKITGALWSCGGAGFWFIMKEHLVESPHTPSQCWSLQPSVLSWNVTTLEETSLTSSKLISKIRTCFLIYLLVYCLVPSLELSPMRPETAHLCSLQIPEAHSGPST